MRRRDVIRPASAPPRETASRRAVSRALCAQIAVIAVAAAGLGAAAPALAKDRHAPRTAPAPELSPRAELAKTAIADPQTTDAAENAATPRADTTTLTPEGSVVAPGAVDVSSLERKDPGGDRLVAAPEVDGAAAASLAARLTDRVAMTNPALAPVIVPKALRAPLRVAGDRIDAKPRALKGKIPLKPRSGRVGYAVVDVAKRRVLTAREYDGGFVPASVAKAPTALYALASLGPSHRFETRLMIDGAVENGLLKGNLYLVGSGDPSLDTGDLADLAKALKANGIDRVKGDFIYDAGVVKPVAQIEPTQPVEAAYNPSVGGLNLNYNRVLMSWRRNKKRVYNFSLTAHAARKSVPARTVSVALKKSAKGGIFSYRIDGGVERWGSRARRSGGRDGAGSRFSARRSTPPTRSATSPRTPASPCRSPNRAQRRRAPARWPPIKARR